MKWKYYKRVQSLYATTSTGKVMTRVFCISGEPVLIDYLSKAKLTFIRCKQKMRKLRRDCPDLARLFPKLKKCTF